MHIKGIPEAITNNKALLFGGAALLAVGAVYYVQTTRTTTTTQAAGSASGNSSVPTYYSPDPVQYGPIGLQAQDASGGSFAGMGSGGSGMPPGQEVAGSVQQTPQSIFDAGYMAGFGASGGSQAQEQQPATAVTGFPRIDPYSLPGMDNNTAALIYSGVDPATAELLAQSRTQMNYDHEFDMTNIAMQKYVVDTNAIVQLSALHASEVNAAASLASTFMLSGDIVSMGTINGSDGMPLLSFAMGQAQYDKKGKSITWLNNTVANGVFGLFLDQTHAYAGSAPVVASGAAAGYGAAPAYDPYSAAYSAPAAYAAPVIQAQKTAAGGGTSYDYAGDSKATGTAGWSAPAPTTTTQVTTTTTAVQPMQQSSYTPPAYVPPAYVAPTYSPPSYSGSRYGELQMQEA